MQRACGFHLRSLSLVAVVVLTIAAVLLAAPAPQQAATGVVVRSIGTLQSIRGNTLTLKTDSGAEVKAVIQGSTRMLRVEPGRKSLSGATPLPLQDLQPGDRILIVGRAPEGGGAVEASSIIAIKRSDIARQQETEEMEWQKNGVGGLVKSVDASTGIITITTRVGGVNKTIHIHTTPTTILRRYAPGSIKFQDAKPSTFAEIQPGDQLRARGALSAGGTELSAVAIVSGSFRNIAGPVLSVNRTADQVTVLDRITKQPVVVSFTPDSELWKLPPRTAQMIASRLRQAAPGAEPGGKPAAARSVAAQSSSAGTPEKAERFGQVVRSLPPIKVDDLDKGDVVMIVSTEGATSGSVTAIKLVSGAAPILTAAPSGKQASTLQSLWSGFGTAGGGGRSGGSGSQRGGESQASG
ncbi:MAG: hypothetical protein ACRD2B_11260, partial [Terriglobia bacterium]